MLKFRILFALRSLMKNKVYTLLNILGLAIGLAVSIIIYLYLQSESDYDKHFPNHKSIYRVHSHFSVESEQERFAGSSLSLAPLLREEYTYIDAATRFYHINYNVLFKRDDKRIYEDKIAVADSSFFRVFEIPFVEGDPATALARPHSIVVSQSFAERYFGDENPVGKVISTNNYDYTVTGLINDIPANTHHHFDALISAFYETVPEEDKLQSLWQVSIYTFLRLDGKGDAERLERDFSSFYEKYMKDVGVYFNGSYDISLERLDKVHFGDSGIRYDRTKGNMTYLYAFGAIGALILMLACINYVNMATARGMRRVKEAGLRKILGSSKREIRLLIFTESYVLSLLSLFVALVLVEVVLEFTPFNTILHKDLRLDFHFFPFLWWLPLALALIVGFFSGWYPAVHLSRVPGLAALQGSYQSGSQNAVLRKLLVGFQFCVSVAVAITALLMHGQMNYIRDKDLGFNREDVVLIPVQDTTMAGKLPQLDQKLRETPHVIATSMAWTVPGGGVDRTLMSIEQNDTATFHQDVVDVMLTGLDYLETMQIKLVEGRDFEEKDLEDPEKVILVNQKMVEEMQWEEPIGKSVKWGFDETGKQLFEARVVGVVSDFNSHSLHEPIEPTVVLLDKVSMGSMHVRVDSEHLLAALNDLEKVWSEADARNPFRFSFLSNDLMNLYVEEHRQSKLLFYLTYLAVFISFLGLTGLASFSAGLRTREIGIRKILGADTYSMSHLLFKDMLVLLLVSMFLAVPLAYVLVKGWLSGFAYTAALNPLVFVVSAAFAIVLAYLVVMFHAVKVARTNPVDTLKHE